MIRALWTASTGMDAQQLNMDVIANNLANVNTTGFKKSRADFQELLYQNIRTAGSTGAGGNEVPAGIQVGLGTKTAAVQKIFTEGDLQKTGNESGPGHRGGGIFPDPDARRRYRLHPGRRVQKGRFRADGDFRRLSPRAGNRHP